MGRAAWRKTTLLVAVSVLAAGVGVLAYATHLLRAHRTADDRRAVLDPRGRRPPADIALVQIDNATFQELTNDRLHVGVALPAPLRRRGHRPPAASRREDDRDGHRIRAPTDERDDDALIEAIGRAPEKSCSRPPTWARQAATACSAERTWLQRTRSARRRGDPDDGLRRLGASLRLLLQGLQHLHRGRRRNGDRTSRSPPRASKLVRCRSTSSDRPKRSPRSRTRRSSTAIPGERCSATRSCSSGRRRRCCRTFTPPPPADRSRCPGPEIRANATSTLLRGVPLRDAPGWLDLALIVAARRRRAARQPAPAPLALAARRGRAGGRCSPSPTSSRSTAAGSSTFVYPLLALAIGTLGTLAVLYLERDDRARAHARAVRALRARRRRRSGAGERRREPAPGRRGARLHRPVQRPARVHELLRVPVQQSR